MIFNKQGATIRIFKFYFQGKEIGTVKQYADLGFTFKPSGKKVPRNKKYRYLSFRNFYVSLKEKLLTYS